MDFLQNFQFILQIPPEILKNRNPIFEISFFYQIRSASAKQKRRPGNSGNGVLKQARLNKQCLNKDRQL